MDKTITLTTILETTPTRTEQETEEEEVYTYRHAHFMTKEELLEKVERAFTEMENIDEGYRLDNKTKIQQKKAYAQKAIAELPKYRLISAATQAFMAERKKAEGSILNYHYLLLHLYADSDLITSQLTTINFSEFRQTPLKPYHPASTSE